MIARKYRLDRQQFSEVFANNSSKHSQNFIFLQSKNVDNPPKFAVVVSKKTFNRRVDRNCIRRLGYQVIKDLLDQGSIKNSGIIMVKKNAKGLLDIDKTAVTQEIIDLIQG